MASELTANLERLARVIEPDNVTTVKRRIDRALGAAPSDAGQIAPTLFAIRKLLAIKDQYSDERLAIVRRYLDAPMTPPEMKDALASLAKSTP